MLLLKLTLILLSFVQFFSFKFLKHAEVPRNKKFEIFRQKVLLPALLTGLLVTASPSSGSAVDYSQYSNERYHTKLSYPSEWKEKSGDLGERNLIAFVDPKDGQKSASIVFTPIPGDFTRLSSFGDLHSYLVPKGEGITLDLIEEKTKGNAYILEYVITSPDEPSRHVKTVFGLRPQETVVGLTIQSKEEDFAAVADDFKRIFESFKFDDDYSGQTL